MRAQERDKFGIDINSKNQMHIYINKNFTNFVIEEGEQVSVPLYEYFTGSLINYDYQVFDKDGKQVYDALLQNMITITSPQLVIASIQLHADTYQYQIDPFPRSTLFLKEYVFKSASMYMIDRNFNFLKFDVTEFSMGNVDLEYELFLDTSILNQKCVDIFHLNTTDTIFTFCISITDQIQKGQMIQYYTIVAIENYISVPNVRYCQYVEFEEHPNLDYPIKYIAQMYDDNGRSKDQSLFLTYQAVYNGIDIVNTLCISRLNLTYIGIMKQLNVNKTILDVGQYPYRTKHTIKFDPEFNQDNIVDYELINLQFLQIAVIFKHMGVLLCQLSYDIFTLSSEKPFSCSLKHDRWVQYIPFRNLISVYYNRDSPDKFYCAISSPPGIVEIDMTIQSNIKIRKVYYANDDDSMFVGKQFISTNYNYIVHAIENLITGQQSLRVYCTQANYFNSVKFDFALPRSSRPNFFIFPNFYLNILWYRDERFVNSTGFFDFKLVFDGLNSLGIEAYDSTLYQLKLNARNPSGDVISQVFNFTFIKNDNKQIISVFDNYNNQQQIFYNCGDNTFQYTVTEYFNGPNYKLQIVRDQNSNEYCDDGLCFFEFVNKNFTKRLDQVQDFSDCEYNFLFPYDPPEQDDDDDQSSKDFSLLICLNYKNSSINSFLFSLREQKLVKQSTIQIPQVKFIKYGYNTNLRKMFVICSVVQKPWTEINNEFHFFTITDQVIWDNFQAADSDFDSLNYIQYLSYAEDSSKGVFVTTAQEGSQIFTEFEIVWNKYLAQLKTQVVWPADDKNYTKRIQAGEDSFFFGMSVDNKVFVYERLWVEAFGYGYYMLNVMWNKTFPIEKQIHSFDIFNEKYFLVYMDDNTIEIYIIELKIYLTYKMRLNFYDYKMFGFDLANNQGRLWRTYYDTLIGFTLFYKDKVTNIYNTFVFIHNLEATQHDSFLIARNVTGIFQNSSMRYTYLTGAGLHNEMTLLATNQVQVYTVVFMNHIALNLKDEIRDKLIKNCSQAKLIENQQGQLIDQTVKLADIKIKPITMFPGGFSEDKISQNDQFIKLKIYTQNQGLAITPIVDNQTKVQLTYSSDYQTSDILGDSSILLESLIEGQSLNFTTGCTFYDSLGNIQDCENAGIEDGSQLQPYSFYLEFVTQQRRVKKSFTMGRLFMMLDTQNYLTVSKLPNDNLDLFNTQGWALEKVAEFKQSDILECNIDNFANYYQFHREGPERTDKPYTLYFIIYQCLDVQPYQLKIAIVKVFDQKYDDDLDYSIQPLYGGIRIPNRIIDSAQVNLTFAAHDYGFFKAKVIITCEIDKSFSNLMKVYSIAVDIPQRKILYTEELEFQSVAVDKDTFKVTQIAPVPNTNLIFVIDENFGFFIHDIQEQVILKWFDINKDNKFSQQDFIESGPLKVNQIVGDWPHSVHLFTNYGIFMYWWDVDLRDRELIMSDIDKYLEPVQKRIIRNKFAHLDQEIAVNQYGYAFLIYELLPSGFFDVYVGAVSFYSSTNSKFFKMTYVTSNQQCISLNQEPYLALSKEDQLAVSFICDTQMYILRVCMRPHIVFQMEKFKSMATRLTQGGQMGLKEKYESGIMNYNQFNITINATNVYTIGEINKISLQLSLEYKSSETHSNDYILIIVIVGLALFMIFTKYIIFNQQKKRENKRQLLNQVKNAEISLRTNTFLTFSNQNRLSERIHNNGLDLQKINKNLEKFFNFESLQTPSKHLEIANSSYDMLIEGGESNVKNVLKYSMAQGQILKMEEDDLNSDRPGNDKNQNQKSNLFGFDPSNLQLKRKSRFTDYNSLKRKESKSYKALSPKR